MFFSRRLALTFALGSLLVVTGVASAQLKESTERDTPAATCPVLFQALKIHSRRLDFKYINSTSKTIQGIDLGAAYYDSVQNPRLAHTEGGFRHRVRPEHKDSGSLDITTWRNIGFTGWMLWPAHILYTDGSSWNFDKAGPSCKIERWLEKQVKPSAIPGDLMAKQRPEIHP